MPFWEVPRDGVGGAQTQDRPYAALLGVVLRPTTWARADTAIPKPASGAGKPVEHQWFSRQSAGEVLQWRLPDSSASRTAPGNMHRRPQLVDEVTPLRRTDQLNERPGRLGVVGLIVATAPGRGARGAVVDGGRRLDPLCTACSYSARTWAGGAPFGGHALAPRRAPERGDLPTTGWSGWLPPALSTRFYAGAACRVDVPGPGGAARSAASGWAKRP